MENNFTVPEDIRLIHNILGTSFSILGFFANIVTLIAIFQFRLYRDIYILFIVNLAVINCLSSGFSLTYIAYQSFTVDSAMLHTTIVCRFTGYITYALLGTEIIAIIQISLNRYFLIVHLDLYRKIYTSNQKVIAMLAGSWFIYFLLALLPCTEVWGKLLYDPTRFICHPFLAQDSFTKFFNMFSIIISVPPLLYCYIAIIWKVVSTRRKVRPRRVSTVRPSKSQVTPPTKMPVTIITILTAFILLYVPFFLVELMDPSGQKFDPKVPVITVYVAWIHLVCHPIIYAVLNKQIQKALVKMFRCEKQNKQATVFPRRSHTISTIAT